MIINGKHLAAS